jgi:hypothetical protein
MRDRRARRPVVARRRRVARSKHAAETGWVVEAVEQRYLRHTPTALQRIGQGTCTLIQASCQEVLGHSLALLIEQAMQLAFGNPQTRCNPGWSEASLVQVFLHIVR